MAMSFCAVLFPRGVLDEILNLIESVSEGFLSYSNFELSSKKILTKNPDLKRKKNVGLKGRGDPLYPKQ